MKKSKWKAIYYCLNHSDFIGAYTSCDMRFNRASLTQLASSDEAGWCRPKAPYTKTRRAVDGQFFGPASKASKAR